MIFFPFPPPFCHTKFNCSYRIFHQNISSFHFTNIWMPGIHTSQITQNRLIYNSLCTHTYISPRLNFCKSKLIKQTLHYALLITRIVKILINNTTIRTHSGKQETRSIRLQLMLCYSFLLLIHLLSRSFALPEILFHTIAHSSIVFSSFLNIFFFDIFKFKLRNSNFYNFYTFYLFLLIVFSASCFCFSKRKNKSQLTSNPFFPSFHIYIYIFLSNVIF